MDDWEKKYWAQKMHQLQNKPQDLPHHEPAHITQDKQRAQQAGNQWREVDPLTAMYTNAQGMAARGMGPQHPQQMVQLREGAIYYKKVDAEGFGTTMPMVRSCGPTVGVVGKDFEMRQECHCYLIDNLQVVDLGNINPQKMLRLVEVRAPFVGTILVERSAVLDPGGRGPKILKG